jgi:membrane-bound lytic murein transglycosylase D
MALDLIRRSLNIKLNTPFGIKVFLHKFCLSSLIISIGILIGGFTSKQAVTLKVAHPMKDATKGRKEITENEKISDQDREEATKNVTLAKIAVDSNQETPSLNEMEILDQRISLDENVEEPFPLPIKKSQEEPSAQDKGETKYGTSNEKEKTFTETKGIPLIINEDVLTFIDYFQNKIRPRFELWLSRSTRYEGIIKEILREYDLPEELFYLALIESGFSPKAVSSKKAVGIWQFIKSTAKRFGLTVNGWVDERRDVIKATRAAAQYLRELYDQFNNWELTLAAYNAGEGNIARVVQKYRLMDFWELRKRSYLKKETMDFVPQFMAAWAIARDPGAYGFSNVKFEDPLSYDLVTLKGGTQIKMVANAIGCDIDQLRELNPHILKGSIPPYHPGFPFRLPKGKIELFLRNYLAKAEESKPVPSKRHVVRSGETLRVIAMKYGLSPEALIKLNGIKNPNLIREGMSLIVSLPPSSQGGSGADRLARAQISPAEKVKGSVVNKRDLLYNVRQGDTIWKIAKRYDLSVSAICEWNNLKENSIIRPGDKLILKLGSL